MTPPVKARVQALLDQGHEIPEVAEKLDLKPNTLAKAVRDGRLHKPGPKEVEPTPNTTSKSQRSVEDSEAPMGMGATDTTGRVAASLGQLISAPAEFQAAADVPRGGVLLALPALLTLGLLRHTGNILSFPKVITVWPASFCCWRSWR